MTSVLEILSLQELYTRKENLLKQLKKVDFEIISRKNEQIIINESQEDSFEQQEESLDLQEDSLVQQAEKEVLLDSQKEAKETPFIPVLHELINKNTNQELSINNINVKIKIKKVQKVQNNQDSSILNCEEEKLIKKIIIKKKS